MSELRAGKSGFAREAQMKVDGKFSKESAGQCLEWIKKLLGDNNMDTSGDMSNVVAQLKDGTVLEKLQKKIQNPGAAVSETKKVGMKFVWIERLAAFNRFIRDDLKVPDHSTFTPENLIEETNVPQVVTCLQSVAMKCTKLPGLGGFGPKEAEANVRHFTEDQLAEGKSVIGLQMGSNKGASQAGQNFGKTRMITD